MPVLTPSVLLANQYEAFPALSGPPHGRAGGQDRPVSDRAGHDSVRQAGLGQRQTGQVRAGQGRIVLGRTGRRHEASAVGQCRTGVSRGGSRKKNSKGRVMNRNGAPTYTQNEKTQQISATLIRWCPIFSFFFKLFFQTWPVVPLLDRWCPWQARGASDWCPC